MCAAILKDHQHGKSRVSLGRTWREGDVHYFVEWTVNTMLESDMAHAFLEGSNTDMTATDTQKNTVGHSLALHQFWQMTDEEAGEAMKLELIHVCRRFTILLSNPALAAALRSMQSGLHGILWRPIQRCARSLYPSTVYHDHVHERVFLALPLALTRPCWQVSKAKVWVEAAPWVRINVDGQPHNHGKLCLQSFFAHALLPNCRDYLKHDHACAGLRRLCPHWRRGADCICYRHRGGRNGCDFRHEASLKFPKLT